MSLIIRLMRPRNNLILRAFQKHNARTPVQRCPPNRRIRKLGSLIEVTEEDMVCQYVS